MTGQTFLLKNGIVFDGKCLIKADVLVKDGVITEMGDFKSFCDNVIDVSNCIISYGFTDIHAHIEGLSYQELGVPPELACIPFGVTEVVDAGCINVDKKLLKFCKIPIYVFVSVVFNKDKIDLVGTRNILRKLGKYALGIKVYFDSNQSNIGLMDLKKICILAKEEHKKVVVHTSNSPVKMLDIIDSLNSGDIITHMYHGGNNTIDEDNYSAYKKAKDKKIILDTAFAGGVHTDFAVLDDAIKNGILPDTISTDLTLRSWNIRGGAYGFTTCMTMLRLAGMQEVDIYKCATINTSNVFNKHNGKILQVGDIANMAVCKWDSCNLSLFNLSGNVLNSEKGYVCKMTILNGRIVYRKI